MPTWMSHAREAMAAVPELEQRLAHAVWHGTMLECANLRLNQELGLLNRRGRGSDPHVRYVELLERHVARLAYAAARGDSALLSDARGALAEDAATYHLLHNALHSFPYYEGRTRAEDEAQAFFAWLEAGHEPLAARSPARNLGRRQRQSAHATGETADRDDAIAFDPPWQTSSSPSVGSRARP